MTNKEARETIKDAFTILGALLVGAPLYFLCGTVGLFLFIPIALLNCLGVVLIALGPTFTTKVDNFMVEFSHRYYTLYDQTF